METPLSPEAIRVLGVLIEKELTTPDYYPMTLIGLTNGCNQKSNRDPVMMLEESEVAAAIEELVRARLAGHASVAGSRAMKYRHAATEHWNMDVRQRSALATLLLRGPQTIGEVKGHTARMANFADLDETADTLRHLRDMEPSLVLQLPVQRGKKEARIAHLLAGPIDVEALEEESGVIIDMTPKTSIRTEIDELKDRLEELEAAFAAFRSQFE